MERRGYVKEQPSEEKKQAAQKFYRTKADRARQVAAKKRIAFLEQKMEENEQTIAQLTEQMGDPQIASDYQKVEEICQQIEQLKNDLRSLRRGVAGAFGGRITGRK